MIFIGMDPTGSTECESAPAENPLETGIINEGCASRPTGTAWYDTSAGTSYGDGRRFAHEEAQFMAKVPSKHDKNRDR
jgi:hypothetical protein